MNNEKTSSSPDRPASWPIELPFRGGRSRVVRGFIVVLIVAASFGLGRITAGRRSSASATSASGVVATSWTCSMHPQFKLPKAGQCPICFMDLIPVGAGGAESEVPVLELSARARALARVETTRVEPREISYEVQMSGKAAVDETQMTYISSYISGRIDRLYVDYTGIMVRKGDHLAEIYSPELLVAQREYLLTLESVERSARSGEGGEMALRTLRSVLDASRRKLELWGIPADEIERMAKNREPSDHLRIDAPVEGWVTQRDAFNGMYVTQGMRLFTVVNLKRLWVLLDAYETDLQFIRYGQSVRFEAESFPGRLFEGTVAYIDPTLNEATRTVKVRLNVPNPDMQLRPGMFVRAKLQARLGPGGEVVGSELAGQWMCPMHPEVVQDAPGKCRECGMDLVAAESLGFAGKGTSQSAALAVPASAVLLTGKRAIVYVEHADGEEVSYEGRTVELGPRAGDWYVVRNGLAEGDRVVTRGALMIDSAMQIQGLSSMMTDRGHSMGEPGSAESVPAQPSLAKAGAAYHEHVRRLIDTYFDLTGALAKDDLKRAQQAATAIAEIVKAATPDGLDKPSAEQFALQIGEIGQSLPKGGEMTVESLRKGLPVTSAAVEKFLRTFGHNRAQPVYRIYCPMAFDNKGAAWLQPDETVSNPYFGDKMLRCGVIKGAIAPQGGEAPR